MKTYKNLNIKGTVLDKPQLEKYLEQIASDHTINQTSEKITYPISNLRENFNFISKVYNLLNEHIKEGINIHPAGEWVLDNFYIIEENVKMLEREITLKKYMDLPGIANGPYRGFARIYVVASEIVAYTDSKIDKENLENLLKAYQNKKSLTMEEIWNTQNFLKIAIIQTIKEICEKVYIAQIQKQKVNSIIERTIENKVANENRKINTTLNYAEIKYPFIEYMSYRLKKYGKEAYPYLKILEEVVNKTGSTTDEIIKKEHFAIAITKVTIGNAINSIKTISRINFQEIFEKINGVEEILKKDPSKVYEKMSYETKSYYRGIIKELSQKTKISEIYIITKALELAKNNITQSIPNEQNKKAHIGYYLIAEGKQELLNKLEIGEKELKSNSQKARIYVVSFFALVSLLTILVGAYVYVKTNIILTIIAIILLYIPISEIYLQILNYILIKTNKQKLIPKLNLYSGIPEENATFVVIPTIINSPERARKLIRKLEVYYLANKSENIYFALLGDCTSSKTKEEKIDSKIIEAGKEEIQKLNTKYGQNVDNFPIFHFLYRKRKWCATEKTYLGWERKRGLLTQFNQMLINKTKEDFSFNSILESHEELPNIKYVITLDSDTNLTLNSATELIGAMAHILNKPEIENGVVKKGYGVIQPRIGIDLISCRKSLFTEIFAERGGTDCYTNAISDIYQDNFEEGIFTGKGIYDLQTFHKVLGEEIPENTVLSHDLLEGSYLKCGLATDILLMDGYPSKYNSYMSRTHRWIRGDWQIIKWIFSKIENKEREEKKNPLNTLSKFKIFDNLRRSLVPILAIIVILLNFNTKLTIAISIISILIPTILDIINFIVFKTEINRTKQKTFTRNLSSIMTSVVKGLLELSFLPNKAYVSINAIIKTMYRLKSQENLLEWTTAEEAEKLSKTDLMSYYKEMFANVIIGALILFYANIITTILGTLWIIGPFIAWYISKENSTKQAIEQINDEEKQYLKTIANKTWGYFSTYINKQNNFLPPDNYQVEGKLANRTSSTNIGLGLLAIISAHDLNFITREQSIEILEKMLQTIEKLQKWNGHLYNWYNTITLEPLIPRYISTVDSGNFIGYLYVLKQYLENQQDNKNKEKINNLINIINNVIESTDFSVLYKEETRLFSVGYNIEENKLTDSYYDFLASEARQASLVAIAKRDVPVKHWYSMSRTLTTLNGYKGLVSWSGTAFEYLMPNVNIKKYPGSLLDESCKFLIMSQEEYVDKFKVPWGISESAYNIQDLNGNYQYKAFGIPWLGLKRGLADDLVVAPYGSILAINDEPQGVITNLKELEKIGMIGEYGFYEAVDYTPSRLKYNKKYEIVKTYMAHHQGLILLSINNLINKDILIKRFHKNPEIEAVDILLQERMPKEIILTKEKKEKVKKLEYIDYENYAQRVYTKLTQPISNTNLIANSEYSIFIDEKGNGFSKYKNILINKYKQTSEKEQGIFFYLKNIRNKKVWSSTPLRNSSNADKIDITFTEDSHKIKRIDGSIETITQITVAPEENVEIRRLKVKNIGNIEETIEITSYFEPVLATEGEYYSHPVFSNMFLKYEKQEENIIVERRKRDEKKEPLFMGVTLYSEQQIIGELEYEIDKSKFFGKNNLQIPEIILNSKPFSNQTGTTVESMIGLKKTIKLQPEEEATIQLIISISNQKQETIDLLEKYKNNEKINNTFELSKARVEAESRYIGIKNTEIELYQKMLSYIIYKNPIRKKYINTIPKRSYKQSELWQYGISGDKPIILVKIKDQTEIEVLEEIIQAYEYFKIKNIESDLVILNEEEYHYESSLKREIENSILNKHLSYLIQQGIFILDNLQQEEIQMLELKSNLILYTKHGNLKTIMKEIEEDITENIVIPMEEKLMKIEQSDNHNTEGLGEIDKLKYYNEYGAFTQDGKEYVIKINKNNKLPTVWSHVIANEKFGTVVTETMGGYTWSENARLNRITAWNNNPNLDLPSEIIYIQNRENGKTWTMGYSVIPTDTDYYITYGFGYAKYKQVNDGILQENEIFIPREDKIKINLIKLKNTTQDKKTLKIIYYNKPVLGEDEIKTNEYIDLNYQEKENILYAKSIYNSGEIAYISSSEKIKSYTGNKENFIGSGNLTNPEGINKIKLSNENSLGQPSCIAIQIEVELEAYEAKEITLVLGQDANTNKIKQTRDNFCNIENSKNELENVKQYWKELLNIVQIKTPLESMNIMLNGWIIYQTIACRIWARTSFYQSGGAFGFRDQLQDTLALKFVSPASIKQQILKASSHQFIEGDVEHWWHEKENKGIRTRFSDDLLWLCYLTAEYMNLTGEKSILEEETPYREGTPLAEGIDEEYDIHLESNTKGTIYEHCIRAIEKAINIGKNGLVKIGSGDWNDGFSTVGNKGEGESIWVTFFLYDILNKFIPICEYKNDIERANKYRELQEKLKKSLNTSGWDGRWYRRAYMDTGEALGSIENEECKIDSIAQSWSIISGAGDNDKKYISFESLEKYLIDQENGIIKLLTPAFDTGKLEPGYIKGYPAGVRENGGQYTHAAIWAVIAATKLGFGNKALEYYRMITPIEHARTKQLASKYKVEPYVIAADVYSVGELSGRGGWTWYTGSSSWYYKAGIEYILGLKVENQTIKVEPCIPKEWKEYSIRYKFKNSIYNICVKNPNNKNTGVTNFKLNGIEIEKKSVKLIDDGKINEIVIEM